MKAFTLPKLYGIIQPVGDRPFHWNGVQNSTLFRVGNTGNLQLDAAAWLHSNTYLQDSPQAA